MSKRSDKDLFGEKFGEWVIIGRFDPIRYYRRNGTGQSTVYKRWLCLCSCGTIRPVTETQLLRNLSKHCGCKRPCGLPWVSNTTHGRSRTALYDIWAHMIKRCTNPKDQAYSHYGGRGITFDPRWIHFENFLKDMGERPSQQHSLGRKNNNGPYNKENCRWETWDQQQNNSRNCRMLTLNGRTMNATQWAAELNMNRRIIYSRLHMGWSGEDTLTRPVTHKRQRLR